jgi:hypothetical protein
MSDFKNCPFSSGSSPEAKMREVNSWCILESEEIIQQLINTLLGHHKRDKIYTVKVSAAGNTN